MPRRETAWRIFQNDGGQWLGKASTGPPLTYLLAARTPAHEDGGRDHDVSVVTAEKVVIARQKAKALTVSSGKT